MDTEGFLSDTLGLTANVAIAGAGIGLMRDVMTNAQNPRHKRVIRSTRPVRVERSRRPSLLKDPFGDY